MMNEKKYKFSGHQTFVLRYGWLEKGFRFARENKSFNDESAIVDLGVGKNMVESIRYWSEMAGIISPKGEPTPFGVSLLDEKEGWDPFLEDIASLWLIHWKIITNPFFLTAGSGMFSFLHKPEFSKSDILNSIQRHLDHNAKKHPSENIILRDIDCYLRSYTRKRRFDKKSSKDDVSDCPLQELNLIQPMAEAEMYRFNIGGKSSLPPEIIGYALWDYLKQKPNRTTLRIQEAVYHEGSPGQVFMLDENSVIEAISVLHEDPLWGSYFDFTESSGIAMIHCTLKDGTRLLEYYYKKRYARE